jgi:hypothetical protein
MRPVADVVFVNGSFRAKVLREAALAAKPHPVYLMVRDALNDFWATLGTGKICTACVKGDLFYGRKDVGCCTGHGDMARLESYQVEDRVGDNCPSASTTGCVAKPIRCATFTCENIGAYVGDSMNAVHKLMYAVGRWHDKHFRSGISNDSYSSHMGQVYFTGGYTSDAEIQTISDEGVKEAHELVRHIRKLPSQLGKIPGMSAVRMRGKKQLHSIM